ncbi:ABC transporter permease [Kitasatospora sp. NPDC048365]|uniref:ABC transporter permease n=1 Tax=Kitasatospora sp. NPDC048365 TaxID=3364050 RepID=UPI0037149123
MTWTPARLRPADVARVGAAGLRARPLRVVLSALGIAIGIAAMLAVIGISSSGRADLDRTLDRLGTNLLTVSPGNDLLGTAARLPVESPAMVRRVGPVESVAAVGRIPNTAVYRNDHIPDGWTNSIAVLAARAELPTAVGARVRTGGWLNPATEEYPGVVLGSRAADRLGITVPGTRVWLGGQWYSVAGILEPVPLASELDSAALIGWPSAERLLHFDGHPTQLYVRAAPPAVEAVRSVLAATANPESPSAVRVSRPSDALAAQRATDTALSGLLLGLGSVALLVGGIGVANTMVISVLERRAEIGLRRSLGATRGQIRVQFLTESLLLSALGGLVGAALGTVATAGYAVSRGWPTVVPLWAAAGGIAATLLIGGLAGLYPAVRAARLSPAEALATP